MLQQQQQLWSLFFNAGASLLCLVGFLYQSSDIFITFINGDTGIGFSDTVEERMEMPAITLCPAKYTKHKFDPKKTDLETYLNGTYNVDDLFHLDNRSGWQYEKNVSTLCY